ncbi:phage holin family protein [bacterium]|nr:phage holin family protein [bacterium]
MKSKTLLLTAAASTSMSFICSYFMDLTMGNIEQYLALVAVVFIDGFFGIAAGVKREGFQTRKAVRVLQRVVMWIVILTVILMVEKGFAGTSWLSETIIVPFIVLQLISALKNASMAGFIKHGELNRILDIIDKHKGIRE